MRTWGAGLLPVWALGALLGCGTPAEEPVLHFVHALVLEERPDAPGTNAMFAYDPGDTPERHLSSAGHFVVHHVRTGRHAPDPRDNDGSGVPDMVERTAEAFERVHALFHGSLGFRVPRADGDGVMDVYLLDFGGAADGAFRAEACGTPPSPAHQCSGFVVMENDFAGYGYPSLDEAVETLASHEYFHAIQAAYHADVGTVFSEGTAVWATERFNPALRDLERLAPGFITNLDRSLDRPLPGPVDPFSYGAALFFLHLSLAHDALAVEALLHTADAHARSGAPTGMLDLVGAWAEARGSTFADVLGAFVLWNAHLGRQAPDGAGYPQGEALPPPRMTAVPFPSVVTPTRLFHASAQYFVLDAPAGELRFTLRAAPDQPAPTDVKWLAVPADHAGAPPLATGDARTTVSVVSLHAGPLVVAVFNTATQGTSARVELCVDDAHTHCGAPQSPSGPSTATPDGDNDDRSAAPMGCSTAAFPAHALPAWALAMVCVRLRGCRPRRTPC